LPASVQATVVSETVIDFQALPSQNLKSEEMYCIDPATPSGDVHAPKACGIKLKKFTTSRANQKYMNPPESN
jgi:hypothetical protein